jgi:hypothetical protein
VATCWLRMQVTSRRVQFTLPAHGSVSPGHPILGRAYGYWRAQQELQIRQRCLNAIRPPITSTNVRSIGRSAPCGLPWVPRASPPCSTWSLGGALAPPDADAPCVQEYSLCAVRASRLDIDQYEAETQESSILVLIAPRGALGHSYRLAGELAAPGKIGLEVASDVNDAGLAQELRYLATPARQRQRAPRRRAARTWQ